MGTGWPVTVVYGVPVPAARSFFMISRRSARILSATQAIVSGFGTVKCRPEGDLHKQARFVGAVELLASKLDQKTS